MRRLVIILLATLASGCSFVHTKHDPYVAIARRTARPDCSLRSGILLWEIMREYRDYGWTFAAPSDASPQGIIRHTEKIARRGGCGHDWYAARTLDLLGESHYPKPWAVYAVSQMIKNGVRANALLYLRCDGKEHHVGIAVSEGAATKCYSVEWAGDDLVIAERPCDKLTECGVSGKPSGAFNDSSQWSMK